MILRRLIFNGISNLHGVFPKQLKHSEKWTNFVTPILTVSRNYRKTTCTLRQKETQDIGFNQISRFNNIWLRESCKCKECFTHETNQRSVLFYKFGKTVQPSKVEETKGTLHVTWSDGHKSEYDINWLNKHSFPGDTTIPKKFLWNSKSIQEANVPVVPYEEYMQTDDGVKTMLQSLVQYGFGLVGGVPDSIESTEEVCNRVCFIQETFFGRMWSFTSDQARGDTAYTNISLGAHTDTTYLSTAAGIQVFHCLQHDGTGGETLLVDGFHSAEQLRSSDPTMFNLLASIPIHHEYIEPGVQTVSMDNILKTNPGTGELVQLRYNHYDRSVISTIHQDKIGEYYEALRKLSEYIQNPKQEYWIKLRPGTVIFVDNWRVMHGRAAFTGNRKVCGCYLPRDDWLIKARNLGIQV